MRRSKNEIRVLWRDLRFNLLNSGRLQFRWLYDRLLSEVSCNPLVSEATRRLLKSSHCQEVIKKPDLSVTRTSTTFAVCGRT